MLESLRNIAIIAHVDHGKTTLVDKLLEQSGTLGERFGEVERVMDSNDIEKERGITILAKNTAIKWQDYRINIVDTPGHADFGGEVERVLSMVDSVLLLVDAVEGPMPQTRFVTEKAFTHGLKPIVVVNKIDREGARPDWVVDQVFDLFDRLGATDEQLDFPIIYASAINGFAGLDSNVASGNMKPLLEAIIENCPQPQVEVDGPSQMQVSAIDYSSYLGALCIGKIYRGSLKRNQPIVVVGRNGEKYQTRLGQIFGFIGLKRIEVEQAGAGDIVVVAGIETPKISDTLCDINTPEALAPLSVDEPTVSMTFQVNTSPFAGKEGKYLTSRQIRERLEQELIHNVALKVEPGDKAEKFKVSGRGELHLGILIENMRREGFELAVSRPEVVFKQVNGQKHEPYEQVTLDIEQEHQGKVMEAIGERKGMLENMQPDGKGRVRLDYTMPSRGLIGFQTEFMTMTSGSGLLYHVFSHYAEAAGGKIAVRSNGAMIANTTGKALAYALFNLQDRGRLFISHAEEIYEGQVIGLHSKDNDLVVNPTKAKQLTNIRAAGTDENLILTPPVKIHLENALELINDDELVEITPAAIRIRKKMLKESDRKRIRVS